ncbi:MAG TPA: PKD domain-containing protein [Polyangiaceae bacterium]|nr:PKD domain-containing protein [Polyangiaceae bacterium]
MTFAVLAGAAATIAVVGCSEDDSDAPRKGARSGKEASLHFAIDIGGGVTLDEVNYVIDNDGNPAAPNDAAGPIDVSQAGSTISAEVGVPLGSNYIAYLTASSADGTVECEGQSSTFNVTSTTDDVEVGVSLRCTNTVTGEEIGSVRINADASVTSSTCPSVSSYAVSPLQVGVGGTIRLTSASSGANATVRWSEGATTIATTANATYTCAAAGAHTLTLTVGSSAEASCASTKTISVTCAGSTGGAGGAGGQGGGGGLSSGGTGGAS